MFAKKCLLLNYGLKLFIQNIICFFTCLRFLHFRTRIRIKNTTVLSKENDEKRNVFLTLFRILHVYARILTKCATCSSMFAKNVMAFYRFFVFCMFAQGCSLKVALS